MPVGRVISQMTLYVDHQFIFRRLLDGEISRLGTSKDLIEIDRGGSEDVMVVSCAIKFFKQTHQERLFDPATREVDIPVRIGMRLAALRHRSPQYLACA